jgi:hypothetical protein
MNYVKDAQDQQQLESSNTKHPQQLNVSGRANTESNAARQVMQTPSKPWDSRPLMSPDRKVQDYQMQLMLLEQHKKHGDARALQERHQAQRDRASEQVTTLKTPRDVQMRHMLSAQQKKQAAARQIQNQQMRKMLLEQRRGRQCLPSIGEAKTTNANAADTPEPKQAPSGTLATPMPSNELQQDMYEQGSLLAQSIIQISERPDAVLPDYEMQLKLLEQQNKKRLLMAKQLQEDSREMKARQRDSLGFHQQLIELEKQNKERLLMQAPKQFDPVHQAWMENEGREMWDGIKGRLQSPEASFEEWHGSENEEKPSLTQNELEDKQALQMRMARQRIEDMSTQGRE